MANDALECANCGHANPAWAQVCRNCGAALRTATPAEQASPMVATGPFTISQGSLFAIGGALGTIAVAILIGVILGGLLPPAPPPIAETSPSASASPTLEPTPEVTPNASGFTPNPSATAAPVLPGTLTFGLGLNAETQRVTSPTDTFAPGTTFAHSIELTAPFGVTQIGEAVAKVNEDGTETGVITAEENTLTVDPDASVDGFTVPTNSLLEALGAGTFVMRVYRGSELLAQGTFILTE
jgi:hypothetical protein